MPDMLNTSMLGDGFLAQLRAGLVDHLTKTSRAAQSTTIVRTNYTSLDIPVIGDDVFIDQHLLVRGRFGRMLPAMLASGYTLGLGIDEDTAAEITNAHELTIVGSGAVFIVDARRAQTDAHEARRDAPLLVTGAVVHSLPYGATFDLTTATLTDFVEQNADVAVTAAKDQHDTATAAAALRH